MTIKIDTNNLLAQKPTGTPAASHSHAKASFWSEFISRAAEAVGLDPNLAIQVARQESGLNPRAVNRTSGALGIMQLMPATAAALGVNPHNIADNIRGGVRYLEKQLSTFGDAAKALAAYNWGPRHVEHAVARWGSDWLSHAPSETRHYVASILSHAGLSQAGLDSPDNSILAANQSQPAAAAGSDSSQPSPEAQQASLRAALDAYLLNAIIG